MPIELTDDEKAALIDLLVGVIEHDLFPQSQRIERLRGVLAKVRSPPELPVEEGDAVKMSVKPRGPNYGSVGCLFLI